MIINELGRCPAWSDNADFANNEEAWVTIFTVAFCLRHAEHILVKYELCKNQSVHVFKSFSECESQASQSNLLTFES